MASVKHWYVVHTYSGYENKVKANLENKILTLGMEDQIFKVVIPMQQEEEVKPNGQKRIVSRKIFPGYVLVEMSVDKVEDKDRPGRLVEKVDERTWYAVRNTPGVTGFVGSGNDPIPLSEEEIKIFLGDDAEGGEAKVVRRKIKVKLLQTVRLRESTGFHGAEGVVTEIDEAKGTVKVLVEMFGQKTPVVVDYSGIEEI